jgi:thiol-disulfide isomerase/thioredoxin
MKTLLTSFIGIALSGFALAEIQTWTNKDGKAVQLELLSVSDKNGELVGEFKMANGNAASIKASDLSPDDAKRLTDFKPADATATTTSGPPSVFDEILDGDLVRLSGRSLKSCKDATKPKKYYLFYYTASWCPPCQKFTPSLVDFYNRSKPNNDDFELILITSDRGEKSMEEYAEEKKMPWPQLKLSKVAKFKQEFDHPGTGIPNLVLTDLKGEVLKASYEGKSYVGPTVVMNHLETLLKSK